MDELLKHFNPATQNNSRKIIKEMLERYMKKPSRGLQKKLEGMGVGVDFSEGYGDDISKPESYHYIERKEVEDLSDKELGELLK
ncbi:MAG TPA: hypothetical protein VEA59_00325 [Patescibacteria group bacterium]|nr:hypothetical protein [Patescibacteria group bacterium]